MASDEIDLSEASLLAEAERATGLRDFGGDDFRPGLRALLDTYDGSARLSARGRKSTRRRLVELLANRLRIADTLRRHPEIRDRPIRRPVYLTGLPRTGTSALFNLLAADPASRPLLLWEARNPTPGEIAAPGQPDPRMVALAQALERARQQAPDFWRIHDARADGPEECVELLAHTLSSVQGGIEVLMPPYDAWFQARDPRPAYAYYGDLLRMLDWQRPGARWLLKSPAHLWALDVLVEMFPDVCIIQTHRDPVEVVGSYCSMVEALMSIREAVDPRAFGPTVLEYLARSVERAMAARAAAPPRHFVDVDYRELMRDPVAAAERVHRAFELPLDEATAAALRAHAGAHPPNRHGKHDYALERYGLTAAAVTDRLAAYVERHGLTRQEQ